MQSELYINLDPLSGQYANYQVTLYRHSFSKPTPKRRYIKILKYINDVSGTMPLVRSTELRKMFPTAQTYPHMLESQGYLEHYRNGKFTFWRLTKKGDELLAKAYGKPVFKPLRALDTSH